MRMFYLLVIVSMGAFLVTGCSHDAATPPFSESSASGEPQAGNGHHEFHTIYWPPPNYPAAVMKLDNNDGEGSHVTVLDVAQAPPGWEGEYPGFNTPYGIAFDIDGTPYGIQNWFNGIEEECFSQLIKIDLETGAVETIGPVHDMNFAGPEFDACGNLYATEFTVGMPEGGPAYVWGDSLLYIFDKHTGEKTPIGDTGHTEWMDLDFDSDGRLWGTFSNDLYTIDTETGASTFVTHIYGVEDNWIPGVCDEDWEYMEVMGIAFDHTRKVTVCHLNGNGTYKPITINLAALAAHLAHGDALSGTEGLDCDCQ